MQTGETAGLADSIIVVLVRTSHPGNIGAAARAMKTMGLTELRLVAPKQFPHPDATARAAGADDVLERARVCETLDEAIADCGRVLGMSARSRRLSVPVLDPREAGEHAVAEAAGTRVALVFGPEKDGLDNAALDRCHRLVTVPANPAYSSLNLAAAVQVLTYEVRMAQGARPAQPADAGAPPQRASAEEVARFYEHLEAMLLRIGFLNPGNPRHLMRRLRRLINRADPDRNEINILHGIVRAVDADRAARAPEDGPDHSGRSLG